MNEITQAVRILREGGLVAFPTETVYGLGADATNAAAVKRIFAAKGRPSTNPLIAHVFDEQSAQNFAAKWPEAAAVLAARFWPGPLTLVLPKNPSIVDEATAGRQTVALRSPDHPVALELLQEFGGAIAAPSANRSTRVSPTTAQHVREELGTAVDLILDGGPSRVGIESTVLDLSGEVAAILRPGAITREQIEAEIGDVSVALGSVDPTIAASSPGMHAVHYSPSTKTFWFPDGEFDRFGRCLLEADSHRIALISRNELMQGPAPMVWKMPESHREYAQLLYATLRAADQCGADMILIEMPPDEPQWNAIRDRLIRAARPLPEFGMR